MVQRDRGRPNLPAISSPMHDVVVHMWPNMAKLWGRSPDIIPEPVGCWCLKLHYLLHICWALAKIPSSGGPESADLEIDAQHDCCCSHSEYRSYKLTLCSKQQLMPRLILFCCVTLLQDTFLKGFQHPEAGLKIV